MNMPSQPLLWHIHHLPNCMGAEAGRVYGCWGRQDVWVRGAGRVYGFGSRQGVWVLGDGRVYGFGEPAGCMGAGCGDSGGDGAFYSDDWSAFTHLTEHA